jgi:hypothetical protein
MSLRVIKILSSIILLWKLDRSDGAVAKCFTIGKTILR